MYLFNISNENFILERVIICFGSLNDKVKQFLNAIRVYWLN